MRRILFISGLSALVTFSSIGTQAQNRRLTREPLIPANLTKKEILYRDGPFFDRAWQMNIVYDHTDPSIRPGIVFVHGGGWKSGDKEKFMRYAIEYAQKGYVCATPAYRLSQEAPFPAAVADTKNAVRWFRAHAKDYYLNPDQIGAYGNSAGAHLVCMLALTDPEDGLDGDGSCLETSSSVQAVVASATPTDFSLFPQRGAAGSFLAGPDDSLKERVQKASPIRYAKAATPPLLLFHGTADKTVNVKHSDSFAEALEKAGAKDVTYIRVEGAGHGVFGQNKEENHQLMDAFFERTLKH